MPFPLAQLSCGSSEDATGLLPPSGASPASHSLMPSLIQMHAPYPSGYLSDYSLSFTMHLGTHGWTCYGGGSEQMDGKDCRLTPLKEEGRTCWAAGCCDVGNNTPLAKKENNYLGAIFKCGMMSKYEGQTCFYSLL